MPEALYLMPMLLNQPRRHRSLKMYNSAVIEDVSRNAFPTLQTSLRKRNLTIVSLNVTLPENLNSLKCHWK